MSSGIGQSSIATANDVHLNEERIADYIALLKPRVMSLVVFTGMVGLYLAPNTVHPFIAIVSILCIAVGSGASGAINMWLERDSDALMERTRNRPLPAGRINPDSAIEMAVVLAVASVVVMALAANMLAGGLLLAAILFYVFIYTIALKRRTPQNIVIGGAAGAFPPLIGWAVVTGNVSWDAIILFAIIFFWTPPHFWALALYRNEDYTRAGIPMLPVVAGNAYTRKCILYYTIALVGITALPFMMGASGMIYLIAALALGAEFLRTSYKLYRHYSESQARYTFKYSILYLFLLFLAMVLDKAILG